MDVTRKQSTPNFPKKESFLPPDTHTYVLRTRWSFLGKFGMLYFLVTLVLRFALLPYYRQYTRKNCTVGCVYKHPKRPTQKVSNILMPILDKIYTEIKEACLMGDFNIKFKNYDSHNTTFQFLDSI